jgi:hypothetical protein
MFFKAVIYVGICAFLGAGHTAFAGGDTRPPARGYSTAVSTSTYHASSGTNGGYEIISPLECINVLDLAGKPTAYDLPLAKDAKNNYRAAMPNLTFDIDVPLHRRRNLHPRAIVGGFSIDLKNGRHC